MIRACALGLLAAMAFFPPGAGAQEPVLLYAAGSLRNALDEVRQAFETGTGVQVTGKFGPSGLLRDEIAAGAKAEVFASANMTHPLSLTRAKRAGPTVLFARNRLCALARPGFELTRGNLIDRMLDPQVKLGTSTPKADPSGDYAWAVFHKVERLRAGSFEILSRKALQLTGGPSSAPAPAGRNQYGAVVQRGDADLFLTYCTNGRMAVAEVAGAKLVELPPEIAVGADYGLTVVAGAPEASYRFALFVLSPEAQAILARHGFSAPGAVEGETP